jgi:hypothetical protein
MHGATSWKHSRNKNVSLKTSRITLTFGGINSHLLGAPPASATSEPAGLAGDPYMTTPPGRTNVLSTRSAFACDKISRSRGCGRGPEPRSNCPGTSTLNLYGKGTKSLGNVGAISGIFSEVYINNPLQRMDVVSMRSALAFN